MQYKSTKIKMSETKRSVSMVTKLGYGTGHILNDMCASMWFTYMLLFFHNVIRLSNTNAGLIVLIGQIADGISTVLVGVFSDQDHDIWIYIRYGKRKVKLNSMKLLAEQANIFDWSFSLYLKYCFIFHNIGMASDGDIMCPCKFSIFVDACNWIKCKRM